MSHRPSASVFLAAVAVLAAVGSTPILGGTMLGQVASEEVRIDGIKVPSGTTVFSPSVLATGQRPAIVHLADGKVLALGQDTRAAFEGDAGAGVRIAVEQGTLALRSGDGEIMTLASNSLLVLDQEGQIGEGTRVEKQVVVCHLKEYTKEKALACLEEPSGEGCEWEPVEVPEAAVPERLEMGDVVAGDNEIGLDEDCDEEGILVPPPAGLTFGEKMAIGGALVAGGVIALDDRNEAASPVIP